MCRAATAKLDAEDSRLLSAYVHELGLVLLQVGAADKTNELGVVEDFQLGLALRGRVITGDNSLSPN